MKSQEATGAYPPPSGFPDPQDGDPCSCGLRRLGRAVYEVEHLRDPARVCHRRDACAPVASGGSRPHHAGTRVPGCKDGCAFEYGDDSCDVYDMPCHDSVPKDTP